jgi:hypothetical protein
MTPGSKTCTIDVTTLNICRHNSLQIVHGTALAAYAFCLGVSAINMRICCPLCTLLRSQTHASAALQVLGVDPKTGVLVCEQDFVVPSSSHQVRSVPCFLRACV